MKARQPHKKKTFRFTWRGKVEFVTDIKATSEGKAWREFRRHYAPHAKKKDFKIEEVESVASE